MKNSLLFVVFSIFFALSLIAQQNPATNIPEPEFINQFYYINDSNRLVTLEKGEAALKTKSRLGGFGGVSTGYILEGAASGISVKSNQLAFVIKPGTTMMMDPSETIRLFQFEKKGKTREVVISKSGMRGSSNTDDMKGITCNIKKTGNGVFIFYPATKLAAGEYGFINISMPSSSGTGTQMKYSAYAFTID